MSRTNAHAHARQRAQTSVLLASEDERENAETSTSSNARANGQQEKHDKTRDSPRAHAKGERREGMNVTCELALKGCGIFVAVVVIIGALVFAMTRIEIDVYEDIVPHVKNPVKFFIINVLVASFGVIPGAASATCVTAGILYGTLGGLALCAISAAVGGVVSFLLSRYAARPLVEKLLVRDGGRFKALDEAVIKDGSQIVLLVRLSPFSPFTAASYVLGLTSVSFTSYALATFVGVMPSTFVYVYLGDTGRRASGSDGATALEVAFYVLGLLLTLIVSYRIAVIAQEAMRNKVGPRWDPSSTEDDDDLEMDVFGTPIDEEAALSPVAREAAQGHDRRQAVL